MLSFWTRKQEQGAKPDERELWKVYNCPAVPHNRQAANLAAI